MPYTEAVIAEVLRHSSIVCGAILHSTTEDVKFLGYFLPKGTIVMANLYNVHHDPKTWSDPEKFKPERFLRHSTTPTSQATTHGMNYEFIKNESLVPFSLGKRVCIAETMAQTEFFLFLTGLLQNFSFSFPVDEPSPDLGVCSGLVLSPIPFKVIVTERP
jgi:cytochrome P450